MTTKMKRITPPSIVQLPSSIAFFSGIAVHTDGTIEAIGIGEIDTGSVNLVAQRLILMASRMRNKAMSNNFQTTD